MKTTRYIAKCKCCNAHTSELVTPEMMRAAQMFDGWPKTQPEPAGRFRMAGSPRLVCRGCGALVIAKAVAGQFGAKHICNEKCLSSTGHVCNCSCGGKNHGASFAA